MAYGLEWARYNADVMAIGCRKCGAEAKNRCRGSIASPITVAHKARIEDAGYRWDVKAKQLVKKGEQ